MQTEDISDPLFRQAVKAIDTGNTTVLQNLITRHPHLIREPLATPNEKGYFENPWLLWFVADNPIRHDKLPDNIVDIARLLIEAYKKAALPNWAHILNYTMGLVETGRIPRKCNVQIPLMELLFEEGVTLGSGMGALAYGNVEAVNWLIEKGSPLTLPAAVGLDRTGDIKRLLAAAGKKEIQTALMVAAFYGKVEALSLLLAHGADPNAYIDRDTGFHSHATPLHQAIWSGSIETVKALVESGADLSLTDKVYNGTPLGWAIYMQESGDPEDQHQQKIAGIEQYLRLQLKS